MRPGGGEAQNHVARFHVARQQFLALGGTHGKARKVIVVAMVHAGHFGGLAANERAAGLLAAIGDAGDDLRRGLHVQLSGCVIVEEKQRLGTLHHEVVHRHGDKVDTHPMVAPGLDGDAQLGAHAVIGGDQDRVLEPAGLEVEQSPEAAQGRIGALAAGGPGERLDRLHQGVSGGNVHPGIGVADTVSCCLFRSAHAASLPQISGGGARRASLARSADGIKRGRDAGQMCGKLGPAF